MLKQRRSLFACAAGHRRPALAGMLLALSLTIVCPTAAADEFVAIRATVFDYLEGINEVNRERIERAFDAGAELKSVGETGALVAEPIADAVERWMAGQAASRTGEILSIDIADGQIARVVFDYDGAYIDFLTLAKLQGEWKIIDKVFIRK